MSSILQSSILRMKHFVIKWQHFRLHMANTPYYYDNWFSQAPPQLIMDCDTNYHHHHDHHNSTTTASTLLDQLSIWFAVPKQKISRQKKRMKTTWQRRIPLKKNIITDPRTGELTLRHRLPFHWRNYLPNALLNNTNQNGSNSSSANTNPDK